MGLFNNIRKKENIQKGVEEYFKLLNAYTPCFSTFEGGLYEMELTRAAVNSFATHCSKLQPVVNGVDNEVLQRRLKYKPNALMDTKKYLARLATGYAVNNNVFIAPIYDNKQNIIGFYPMISEKATIVSDNGVKFLRYKMSDSDYVAIELERCGIMNQMQFRDELFGETNFALRPTLELMHTQNEAIKNGVKQSANIRFLAKLASTLKPSDIALERKRFSEENLSSENSGGVMLIDQKYQDVKQLTNNPFIVDSEQMKLIRENVFNYFGTNEKILQNKYTSNEWNAYYESKIEPFAIEASLVHTNMTFTEREIAFGNEIIFAANRMQYLSNEEKLQTVTQLFDRGFLTHNEGREILNLTPVEDGDKRYIRKEYALSEYEEQKGEEENAN